MQRLKPGTKGEIKNLTEILIWIAFLILAVAVVWVVIKRLTA